MAYTETHKKASLKYAKNKLKRVPLDLRIEDYESLKAHCENTGISINGFIKSAIKEKMERDNSGQ